MLDDALDRAILAGCIAPFQSDQQLAATGDHLALQRAGPDLKRMELLGVAGRRSVLLVLAHIDLTISTRASSWAVLEWAARSAFGQIWIT